MTIQFRYTHFITYVEQGIYYRRPWNFHGQWSATSMDLVKADIVPYYRKI